MSSSPAANRFPRERPFSWSGWQRGTTVSAVVLVAVLLVLAAVNPKPLSYFDFTTIAASTTGLALAGLGETLVILGGGLDLSVGATISLVNVVLVTQLGAAHIGTAPYTLAAIALALGLGALMGAINGVMVGYLRLQSIIVTLATMFVAQGLAMLVLKSPGGEVADGFATVFVGDVIPNVLPAPVVVILLALAAWFYLKRTRTGTALYAVGSDAAAAESNRVNVPWVQFLSFTLGGAFYGWAGLFITANSGSGDPLIGASFLLKTFAAVVLGGTLIGGGRGGVVGTIFGAVILTVIVNILLILGVQTYYAPIVEGVVLLLAVVGMGDLGRAPLRAIAQSFHVRNGRHGSTNAQPIVLTREGPALAAHIRPGWIGRNARTLRFIVPAYVLLLLVILATAIINGSNFRLGTYLVSLLTFGSFLGIIGLGQGAVITAGGFDLSVAWAITFPAIVMTTFSGGSDAAACWAIPLAIAIGALIGLLNGVFASALRISPIIATLATGGILEGVALVFSNGAPIGNTPPALDWFLGGRLLGLPPVVWFFAAFVIAAILILNGSGVGRRLRAIGNGEWAARLSGVRVGGVVIAAYVLSGVCSAIVGLLLAGFAGHAFFDMGKPFLLASIAVVVLGGSNIAGGQSHYVGILGGALLFTALGSMLQATSLPEAARSIIYGAVLLAAVVTLRHAKAR